MLHVYVRVCERARTTQIELSLQADLAVRFIRISLLIFKMPAVRFLNINYMFYTDQLAVIGPYGLGQLAFSKPTLSLNISFYFVIRVNRNRGFEIESLVPQLAVSLSS